MRKHTLNGAGFKQNHCPADGMLALLLTETLSGARFISLKHCAPTGTLKHMLKRPSTTFGDLQRPLTTAYTVRRKMLSSDASDGKIMSYVCRMTIGGSRKDSEWNIRRYGTQNASALKELADSLPYTYTYHIAAILSLGILPRWFSLRFCDQTNPLLCRQA